MKKIKFGLAMLAIAVSVTFVTSSDVLAVVDIADLKPVDFKILPISNNEVILLWKNSTLTPPPAVNFTGLSLISSGTFGIWYHIPTIMFNGSKYLAYLDTKAGGRLNAVHPYMIGTAYSSASAYPVNGVVSYDNSKYATTDLQSIAQSQIHVNANAPQPPKGVVVSTVDYQSLKISWDASPNATGYLVYRDDFIIAAVTGTTYTEIGLPQVSTHKYTVSSYSGENISARSVGASGTTAVRVGQIPVGATDTEAPSDPTNLKVVPVSNTTVEFSWTPSTDDVGVAGYYIYRDRGPLSLVRDGVAMDYNVPANTTHTYFVQAYDASGHLSRGVDIIYAKIEPINGVCVPTNANLSRGSVGPQVRILQEWLLAHGFSIASIQNGGNYGTYGAETTAAVSMLQKTLNMDNPNGNWGSLTRTALETMCATFPSTGNVGTTVPPVVVIPPVIVTPAITTTNACHAFDVNLTSFTITPPTGAIGTEVTYMQKWLISQGFHIPSVETGSASYGYYAAQTVTAVRDFQRSVGISNGDGNYWGPTTRAKANALCNTASVVVPPVVVIPPAIVTPATTTPVIIPPVAVIPPTNTQVSIVKVLYPNGGEAFTSGQQIQVRWNATSEVLGITSSSRVRIDLNLGSRNILSVDNLVNDGNETITIPSTLSTDSAYTVSVGAYGTKGGLTDVSDGGFSITSPVIKPVSNFSIRSYLSDTAEDWVTATTFTSGNGRGGTKNDWNWYAEISGTNLDSTGKIIRSITVYSNSGEGWSTSASTDNELRTVLMPLRAYNIYTGQYMSGYDVDLGLKISAAQNPVELVAYGQIENKSFTGGRMVIKFTDGSSITAAIPAYTGTVSSAQQVKLTASIWDAIKQYCLETPKDKYCALGL